MPVTTSIQPALPAHAASEHHFSYLPDMQQLVLQGLFAWFGMLMGSWASRIPALTQHLHMSHTQLSLVLLCAGLGAVLSIMLSGYWLSRFSSTGILRTGGAALLSSLMAIGAMPTVPCLMLAVFMLGIAASLLDVALNTVATQEEHSKGLPILSRLHACACAGGLAGITLGSLMAWMDISPLLHFSLIALPMLYLLPAWIRKLKQVRQVSRPKTSSRLGQGSLSWLGALGFMGAIAEGSIAGWSGIFMKEQYGTGEGFAPMALLVFSVMMLLARLQGDQLKNIYGAQKLVCCGGLMASAGMFVASFAANQYLALAGFALTGLGLALLCPFIFSAAGNQGTAALSSLAIMSYGGGLMGPPLLGTIAQTLGLQAVMVLTGTLMLGIALASLHTRWNLGLNAIAATDERMFLKSNECFQSA